jgi:membrane-bound lytic murein transglycosylase A
MWHNESYVFFRWVKEGPMGSLNVPLTAGRSIATDPRSYPRGALAYLETVQPRVDEAGQVISWGPLRRWALNQDTGGAIKGPGRVDLFCGTGDQAEAIAGRMKHPGKLYFFVKKGESLN